MKTRKQIAQEAIDAVCNDLDRGLLCSAEISADKKTLTVSAVGVIMPTRAGDRLILLKEKQLAFSETYQG